MEALFIISFCLYVIGGYGMAVVTYEPVDKWWSPLLIALVWPFVTAWAASADFINWLKDWPITRADEKQHLKFLEEQSFNGDVE